MIPKVIHYCWFGSKEKPEKVKKCIESWKKYCPDYQIIEWNESNYDISKNRYMHEAYKMKKWGFVPDFARLDIIYEHGGIYLDTDVELIKCLDSLLENKCFMGFEDEMHVNLGSGFGAEKHHKILLEMMNDIYKDRLFIKENDSYDSTPSPILSTDFLLKKGLKRNNTLQNISNVLICPSDYFCPKNFETFEVQSTSNTYSIHHFDMSWVSEESKYRHSLQIRLNKILPLSLSKNIAKAIAVIKYRGIKNFLKILRSKL